MTTHMTSIPGPGLAIRVICQNEAFIRDDFSSTNTLLALISSYSQACQNSSALLTAVQQFTSHEEQEFLTRISQENSLCTTLLPIYSVGVQVGTCVGHVMSCDDHMTVSH